MKPIRENVVIQIEITNACHLSCANCSRLVGHHRKPFFMSLDQVRQAIASLDGFPGRIGCMGGEPAIHPEFLAILAIYREMIPDKRRREFWTAGYRWDEYLPAIRETFDEDLIHYNDHSKPEEGWHQPLLISIDEVVPDKTVMWRLINNCWVQRRWSASITPKGAFFCEVAAALSHALDGPEGWAVAPGWWETPEAVWGQQKQMCLRCSAALPMMERPNNHEPRDKVSAGNLAMLEARQSPKVREGRVELVSAEHATEYLATADPVPGERGYLASHPDWQPSQFRTKVWHAPGEGDLDAAGVRALQRAK